MTFQSDLLQSVPPTALLKSNNIVRLQAKLRAWSSPRLKLYCSSAPRGRIAAVGPRQLLCDVNTDFSLALRRVLSTACGWQR
ncbi:hypothetical protein HBI49_193250 [Parastagonospora nodorum]|nr:hypothetical protein HBH96_206590 [Parastagonospora nodorum]KAH5208829.1 hypothetical protein HBI62_218630 [Parastagonospora nodorum]KAH5349672.1 hypothetical protein HBI49_193250 [Parastagonospora nodorum]KAH5465249.1 hypothetical protein HBI28_231670 [Parastagonospora nodorum]KAH5532010.1 hypothetical protein HBI27_208900 [Parastagonospora nodorum]